MRRVANLDEGPLARIDLSEGVGGGKYPKGDSPKRCILHPGFLALPLAHCILHRCFLAIPKGPPSSKEIPNQNPLQEM